MTPINFRALLSEGLDLCVRGRKLNEVVETVASPTGNPCGLQQKKSGSPALWALDQYERDLEAWEARARHALAQGEKP